MKKEMPRIVTASLEDMQKDSFNSMPESFSAGHVIQIATALIAANLSFVYALLLSYLIGYISPNSHQTVRQNANRDFHWMNKLRLNVTFLKQMKGAISDHIPANIPQLYSKPFIQRFLTEFTIFVCWYNSLSFYPGQLKTGMTCLQHQRRHCQKWGTISAKCIYWSILQQRPIQCSK